MTEALNVSNFLEGSLNAIFKNTNIDYIIKITKLRELNLHISDDEKLLITIIRKKDNKKFSFKIENDNIDYSIKLKNIIIKAVDLKYVEKDSSVVFIFDKTINADYSLGIIVLEVSRVLYRIGRFKLTEFMENEAVLEKVIQIAEEIRKEGREGKTIGTLFVIGEESELAPYMKPLVLNPFYGYPENLRDILVSDLNETIKEYAQLDGAFVISNKGIVISAGTYIDVNTEGIKKYLGWGTKHLAAVAITEKTKSIAVLVSESGNVIKLFKNGKLILKY